MQETAQMLHRRVFPREQLEDFVSELAFSYPKCFVTDSRLKRPLKKNIALDQDQPRIWTLVVRATLDGQLRRTLGCARRSARSATCF